MYGLYDRNVSTSVRQDNVSENNGTTADVIERMHVLNNGGNVSLPFHKL